MTSETILQHNVSSEDVEWNWKIGNKLQLTGKRKANRKLNQIYVKAIRVSNQNITLSLLLTSGNRAVAQENKNDFIHISFHNLNFTDTDDMNKPELTQRYIERLLKAGVYLNSEHYTFYGHSNSQLQSRSCYLRKENVAQENFRKIRSFGSFDKINSVSKLAKRIGLLFTSANIIIDLDETKCELMADVERDNLIFSDGCGCINENFAKEISNRMRINQKKSEDETNYPSVYQIRYMGYKGVLMVAPNDEILRIYKMNVPLWKFLLRRIIKYFKSQPDEIIPSILFRKSMKKFDNCSDTKNLLVVDYSKPFTYGKLNEELIILLSTLKIPSQVFIDRLKHHLDLIEKCTTEYEAAKELARLKNVRIERYPEMNQRFSTMQKIQKDERSSFFDQDDKSKIKVSMLIEDSRLLFGVCDFTGKLREGECFVRYTELIEDESSGQWLSRKKVLTGKILVGRNPCLYPGDIQTFQAVDERNFPELKELCDCIVFSIHGEKPAPSLMSGGDLDGDRFFVCWDKQLIPNETYHPIDYSKLQPTLENQDSYQHNNDQLIKYFSRYNNFSLGQLKSLYLYWARSSSKVAASSQCIKINELFSKCVDGGRIKVPRELQKPNTPVSLPTFNPPFIIDVLEGIIKDAFVPNEAETAIEGRDDLKVAIEEQEVSQTYIRYFKQFFSKMLEFLNIFLNTITDADDDQPNPPVLLRPVQLRPVQLRTVQLRPVQLRPFRLRPFKLRPAQLRPVQFDFD